MLTITAIYAGLLAFVLLILSARVITYRRANSLGLGDEGDRDLLRRMRAHANCAEYAPFGIVLMAIAELQGAHAIALHLLGLMLLAGRVIHAIGFSRQPAVMAMRVFGMMLTLTMIAVTALGLLLHAIL